VENTYKMKPDKPFQSKPVEDIIKEVLKAQLQEEVYEPRATKQVSAVVYLSLRQDHVLHAQLSKTLATIITSRVQALEFSR
jgi:hypothetical protein